MPTYDYRCNACGHAFELMQAMSAPVKRKCGACGELKLERLIGIGAGFYVKGKASGPPTPPAKTAAKTTDSADTKAGTTTIAKPDAKPDTTSGTTVDSKPDKASTPAADTSPPEKRISGATSTPTHKAREGRGVGNLVDRAKRLAKPAPKSGANAVAKKRKGKK